MLGRSSDIADALVPDPLSEVLQDLRITGVSYSRCELSSPWGLDLGPQNAARFHFIASGECWLGVPGQDWIRLREGDVVLLPHGTGHTLASKPQGRAKPVEKLPHEEIGERTYRLRAGGGGAQTLMACCNVSFEEPALHPLLELMPPVLLVHGAATEDETLPLLLELMAKEVLSQRVGTATVMTRLADVLITRVVRAWVEAQPQETTGWLGAIRDPKIGRALAAIHQRPGHPWSVEALAEIAQTSRSIFSERFNAVVGMPPARYLARWRMHLASRWLRKDRLTVSEAASRLGYDSEASFSRAFKRFVGVPPSALRRDGRDGGPSE